MSDRQTERAEKVVQRFKDLLGTERRGQIQDSEFNELVLLVRTAISEELELSADEIEALAKKIRAELDKRELEL